MTWADWLTTPQGVELTHALVLLLVSVAAWFSYRAHEYARFAARDSQAHARKTNNENSTQDARSSQAPLDPPT